MMPYSCAFSFYTLSGPARRCCIFLVILLIGAGPTAFAQVALTSGSTSYTTTTTGLTINVSGSYSGNITLANSSCTVNFNSISYGGTLSVTATGCTINNNSGSTISSSGNSISAAATLNNNAGATWTGNFYSGVAVGSTVNNAGSWGPSGPQFSPLNGITINNSGTWKAISYGVQSNPVTITNSGTWTNQLGNIDAALTLTNAAGATWTQALASGSGSVSITNNGTWNAGINFPSGSNTFNNNSGSTATFASLGFGGTTVIRNGNNGGTPTMTFSGNISPSATTSIINLAGTVNTNSGISNAGTVDNRGTWNASAFTNSSTLTNSSLLKPTTSYTNSGGTTTNTSVGTIDLTAANATYTNSGGTTTNSGTINVATSYTTSGGTTTNNSGATMQMVTYTNNGGNTTNSGTLNPSGNFVVGTSGGLVTNNSTIAPAGYYQNGGATTNNGTIRPGTYYDNQNSGATTTNNGTIRPGTYYSNKATTINNGNIILTAASGYFENLSSGTFTDAGRVQVTGSFTNNGTFNGSPGSTSGAVRVAGVSTNTATGFGASGLLDFCDSTPGAGPPTDKGFNVQTGSVAAAVTSCLVAPLPVELTRFAATAATGRVLLAWATASEKNSHFFAIERSANGRDFARIAEVAGQGSTTQATQYQATDAQPLPGQSYYRLRQVDFDGTTAYSPIAVVNTAGITSTGLSLAPNPVADVVMVDLTGLPDQAATLEVRNMSGQLLLRVPAMPGTVQPLSLRALPAGVYLLQVQAASRRLTQRLLKL